MEMNMIMTNEFDYMTALIHDARRQRDEALAGLLECGIRKLGRGARVLGVAVAGLWTRQPARPVTER
jgi:hypothetical protein